jgi:hypothetical protein
LIWIHESTGKGGILVRGQWQPYPNHPKVKELTQAIAAFSETILAAIISGDKKGVRGLIQDKEDSSNRLRDLTAELLQDDRQCPRWLPHTDADADAGATLCMDCGNNIPAGETRCSYCGWTYLSDAPDYLLR